LFVGRGSNVFEGRRLGSCEALLQLFELVQGGFEFA
jgi:hypothetical protein